MSFDYGHDYDRSVRMRLADTEGGLPSPAAKAVLNVLEVHGPRVEGCANGCTEDYPCETVKTIVQGLGGIR
jgi:hypothetical protein